MLDDLKSALRSLLASRAFTVVALTVLALGIGAGTAIFSVVDAVVLRGLPFDEHDRLGVVYEKDTQKATTFAPTTVTPQTYLDWRGLQQPFQQIAAVSGAQFRLRTEGGEPADARAQRVTPEFFPVLRVAPLLGRAFNPDDEIEGRHRVAILTYGFWQRRYGGAADAMGKTIDLSENAYQIVGVMPASFSYPVGSDRPADLLVPMMFSKEDRTKGDSHNYNHTIIGRLKDGVSFHQATEQMWRLSAAARRKGSEVDAGPARLRADPARSSRRQGARLDADAARRGRARAADRLRQRREPDAGARDRADARDGDSRRTWGQPVAAGSRPAGGGAGAVDRRRAPRHRPRRRRHRDPARVAARGTAAGRVDRDRRSRAAGGDWRGRGHGCDLRHRPGAAIGASRSRRVSQGRRALGHGGRPRAAAPQRAGRRRGGPCRDAPRRRRVVHRQLREADADRAWFRAPQRHCAQHRLAPQSRRAVHRRLCRAQRAVRAPGHRRGQPRAWRRDGRHCQRRPAADWQLEPDQHRTARPRRAERGGGRYRSPIGVRELSAAPAHSVAQGTVPVR